MQSVPLDAHLADLVHLDVLDLSLDGTYLLNAAFRAEAIALHARDPSRFDSLFGDLILARAAERGVALVDLEGLVLAALEIGASEPEAHV